MSSLNVGKPLLIIDLIKNLIKIVCLSTVWVKLGGWIRLIGFLRLFLNNTPLYSYLDLWDTNNLFGMATKWNGMNWNDFFFFLNKISSFLLFGSLIRIVVGECLFHFNSLAFTNNKRKTYSFNEKWNSKYFFRRWSSNFFLIL